MQHFLVKDSTISTLKVFFSFTVQSPDADPVAKYRAGFITCASEVTRMVMGFPGLDESVKFNVMKHLANCCTAEQRQIVSDAKVKQEVTHEPIVCQNTRIEPTRSQESKIEPIRDNDRGQGVRLEPIRGQDSRMKSVRGQDSRHEAIRGQDSIIDSIRGKDLRMKPNRGLDVRVEPLMAQERSNAIARALNGSPGEVKTVGEKRLMYQQLLSRAGLARKVTSSDARVPHSQYPSSFFEHRTDEEKLQQLNTKVKGTRKYATILPSDANNKASETNSTSPKYKSICASIPWTSTASVDNVGSRVEAGFKAPQNGKNSDGNLIKPVPQLPEKFLISGGIRLMPATVLVPVQVGYAPFRDYQEKSLAGETEKSSDVWRPWERIEQLNGSSKVLQNQGIFSW